MLLTAINFIGWKLNSSIWFCFSLSFRNICSGGYSVIFTHSIGINSWVWWDSWWCCPGKDIQLVYGTANNTKINPGGEQHIKEFGVSSNTEIKGGYQYIEMNGTAEYSVLNDGYQIVQMGGAANQTTLNNGVLQVYGAANDPTIKGGRLIVEKDGITVLAAIEREDYWRLKRGISDCGRSESRRCY